MSGFVAGALSASQQQRTQAFSSSSARLRDAAAGQARATCTGCGSHACLCTPSYGRQQERKQLKFAARNPGMASFAGLRPTSRLGRTLRRSLEGSDPNAELLQLASSARGEDAISLVPRAVLDFIKNLIPGKSKSSSNVSAFQGRVKQINELESQLKDLSLDELKERSLALRKRVKEAADESAAMNEVLPEAFALAREVSRQVLGLRHFDVQLIGGMVLHERRIAEMKTGEGKTLVATLPAYLNALSGRGVHIVTVNDYLARRDQEIMGQVFRGLGLTVGLIQNGMESAERRSAYACDITYCTNSELGFDYLRDNMALEQKDLVQRPFNFCIVDEARTPLIISGQGDLNVDRYKVAAYVADQLRKGVDYEVNEKQKSAQLTDGGWRAIEGMLGVSADADMQARANFISEWSDYCNAAIRAKEIFLKDKQYIVKDGEVVIVDEFTGRVMPGRRWSDGLHQAIEAKARSRRPPARSPESKTIASISYQALFKLFPRLSGMTGTALTEEAEFLKIYDLPVVAVPTNKPLARADEPDQARPPRPARPPQAFPLGLYPPSPPSSSSPPQVYVTQEAKWNAVVEECEAQYRYRAGRPVLIGTTNVAFSELLAARFDERGIPHQVLNARPEVLERESEIIAQAGRVGQLTIATNMAGRGTDIILGGNPTFMARLRIREELFPAIVKQHESVGLGRVKDWKVSVEGFYPTELSAGVQKLVADAVAAAKRAYPEGLDELAAEELLAICGEKIEGATELVKALQSAFDAVRAPRWAAPVCLSLLPAPLTDPPPPPSPQEYAVYTDQEKARVVELGGLYILGTERHESRRIDNQLRGRAGRQGDPGKSRFFLSLEDDLLRVFGGGPKMQQMFRSLRIDETLPIASKTLTASLDNAQKKVENYYFDSREQLFKFDEPMTSMRSSFYEMRRKEELAACGDVEELEDLLCAKCEEAYDAKFVQVEKIRPGLMKELERYVLLTNCDEKWQKHLRCARAPAAPSKLPPSKARPPRFLLEDSILADMRSLQERNRLAYYRQRDPLIEYRSQSQVVFNTMAASPSGPASPRPAPPRPAPIPSLGTTFFCLVSLPTLVGALAQIENIKKESIWQLFNVRESGPVQQAVPSSPSSSAPVPVPVPAAAISGNGNGNGSSNGAVSAVPEVGFESDAASAAEEKRPAAAAAAAASAASPKPAKKGNAKGGKKGKGKGKK
eukprot:tig00000219_g19490.t1